MIRYLITGVVALLLPGIVFAQGTLAMYCSSPNTALVPGHGDRLRKSHGRQGLGHAKGNRRAVCADQGRGCAAPKATSGGRERATRFCRPQKRVFWNRTGRPTSDQLQDWAKREAELSKYRVAGVYGGVLALGYNTEVFEKRKLPVPKCWKDLAQSRLQRRGHAVEPELVRHRLPHAGNAGADLRRGRSVPVT